MSMFWQDVRSVEWFKLFLYEGPTLLITRPTLTTCWLATTVRFARESIPPDWRCPWFELLKSRFKSPVVLDFGSGAGYLAKITEDLGFECFGIEISAKLVEFSKQRVNFSNVYRNLEDVARQFDGIFMADVVEHFDPARSRAIVTALLERLKPGGLLIGNTPNIHSVNILICKERDPVIAPRSHICYFSPRTVDLYLQSLGLTREKLYSLGLSSDSFFQKSKSEPSFLKKSWGQQRSLFAALCTVALISRRGTPDAAVGTGLPDLLRLLEDDRRHRLQRHGGSGSAPLVTWLRSFEC